jgi:hypothetical protein
MQIRSWLLASFSLAFFGLRGCSASGQTCCESPPLPSPSHRFEDDVDGKPSLEPPVVAEEPFLLDASKLAAKPEENTIEVFPQRIREMSDSMDSAIIF